MLEKIEEWIHQLNASHKQVRHSCSILHDHFNGFYSIEFLKTAYFVVTDNIPKPDFPELREAGLGNFIDMDGGGITYNDTYYIKQNAVNELSLHFHELVHVIQYDELTQPGFIKRYIQEIQDFGYDKAPLENMAYGLEKHYKEKGRHINVEQFVRKNL